MQWAEGGRYGPLYASAYAFLTACSLDDFINARLGHSSGHGTDQNDSGRQDDEALQSTSARIRAFRARARGGTPVSNQPNGARRKKDWKPVHLLGADEVKGLFADIVGGLAFLVSGSRQSI